MKTFKKIAFTSLVLFSFTLTAHAEDSKKPTNQTNTDKKAASIKFAPNYKKSTLDDTALKDTYKRAIHIEVEKNIDEETMNKMADERCRTYNLKKRKNYYVSFINNKNGNAIKDFDCADIDGLVIERTNNQAIPSQ